MTSPQPGKPSKRTAIDICVFFSVITVAIPFAFGIGVALGTSPHMIPTDLTPSPPDSIGVSGTGALEAKTDHSPEIGKKINTSDLNEHHVNFQQPVLEDFGDGAGAVQHDATTVGRNGQEHLPAGQYLLVDLLNIEAAFLNSEQRLASDEDIRTKLWVILSAKRLKTDRQFVGIYHPTDKLCVQLTYLVHPFSGAAAVTVVCRLFVAIRCVGVWSSCVLCVCCLWRGCCDGAVWRATGKKNFETKSAG